MIIDKKRTITISNIENKNVTILMTRKNKNVKCYNGETVIMNLFNRVLININNCKELDIAIVPTNLKKSRVYIESDKSEKLRKIITKKYKRVNN